MERNKEQIITEKVRAGFEKISRQDYGWIPIIGVIISKFQARWATKEFIRLQGLQRIEERNLEITGVK